MTVKDKLEKYDLFDQSIIRHGMLKCIRDYEVIAYLLGMDYDTEAQFILKGCIKVDYRVIVASEHYSMDERLLELDRQDEPDYPKGFIWGVNYALVYPGWELKEDTEELKILEKTYGLKFYEIFFETNAYNLKIIFHDIEIKELNRIEKSATPF